jgi:ATP-binding protein involved in chromosome partitioning
VDREQILKELKKINYPGYSRDIVSFGLVGEVKTEGSEVFITMRYTTQSPQLQEEIEKRIKEQLKNSLSIEKVSIKKTAYKTAGAAQQKEKVSARFVIAIASGKGGVGKSSVTAILGVVLSKMGYKIGIVDADVYGPTIPLILGISQQPVVSDGNYLIAPSKENIKVISIGLIASADEAVIWRGPMINKALDNFLFDVYWGALDFMLIDLPPGTGDAPLSLTQLTQLTGVIVVSTPQKASANIAKKAAFMFRKLNVPILGVIENMSYFVCDKCNSKHFLYGTGITEQWTSHLNIPILGKVPINSALIKLSDEGNLLNLDRAIPSLYEEYYQIARNLLQVLKK